MELAQRRCVRSSAGGDAGGAGRRRGGWACGRASIIESTSIASLCAPSAAPSCRHDGAKPSCKCAARGHGRCGPRCASAGGGTGGSCDSCEAISRWWRARAPANTATNVSARAAPVCVALLPPRRVEQDRAPPEACAQIVRWGWRMCCLGGTGRGGPARTLVPRVGDRGAAKAAADFSSSRPVGSSERPRPGGHPLV